MKALVYTDTCTMQIQSAPEPELRPGDALVEVEAVGICGSDMHAYLGHDPRRVPPMILGHEVAGTVLQGNQAGRRVVLNPLITCGRCDACLGGRSNLCADRELIGMNRPGGFAQRIAIPEHNLIEIPAGMDAAHAALTEPAATALHALHLAARAAPRPLAEGRALVIGGGSVGLCAALWLRAQGCRELQLAETNPLRRDTAERAGVRAFDPAQAPAHSGGFELVVDAVGGALTRASALQAVAPGGTVMHIGLQDSEGPLDIRRLTLAEITFIGTYTYTAVDLRATVARLHDGSLGGLAWVEQRPMDEGAGAFDDLLHARSAAPKILLRP